MLHATQLIGHAAHLLYLCQGISVYRVLSGIFSKLKFISRSIAGSSCCKYEVCSVTIQMQTNGILLCKSHKGTDSPCML